MNFVGLFHDYIYLECSENVMLRRDGIHGNSNDIALKPFLMKKEICPCHIRAKICVVSILLKKLQSFEQTHPTSAIYSQNRGISLF